MSARTKSLTLALAAWVALLSGAARGAEMVFDPKDRLDYFAVPYPNDLHRYPDGRVDRHDYPVPVSNPVTPHYRKIADGMDGFGVSESVFFRFTGDLDDSALPGPEASLAPGSPVFLVNLDRSSPGYGEKVPLLGWFHRHPRGSLHHLLALSIYPGFTLRENTLHAAVVLRALDPGLNQSAALAALLAADSPPGDDGRAVEIYRPLVSYLAEQGIDPAAVAAATVYTTGDPTVPLRAIMDYVHALPPAQLSTPPEPYRDHPSFYALASSYSAPQFQTGKGSQLFKGGKVSFDANGAPVVQREEQVPIKIVVPKGKMPRDGFPLVIYLHGGANDSKEFLDHIIYSKEDAFTPGEGPARVFAQQGIAGVSMAIVKNPERYDGLGKNGRLAELPFYNFFRGEVLAANHWQASADASVLLQLMRELAIDPSLCPATDASAGADGKIRFNPRLFFGMGFSMGGTILGSWAAVEPGLVASIPSGGSGNWGLLIRNFTGVPAKPYFFAWLTAGHHDEPMDMRWPTISLIQAALEPCDTITFGPHVYRRPFPGHPARNLYLAMGRNDYYTQVVTQDALAISLGAPLAGPETDDSALLANRLMGYDEVAPFPIRENVRSEDGRPVTAAWLLYPPDDWTNEGHNVNYNLTETKHQYGCMLRALAELGVAAIPPPAPEGYPCGK